MSEIIDFSTEIYAKMLKEMLDNEKKELAETIPLLNNYKIIVSDEQSYMKTEQIVDPFSINVVIKKNSGTIVYSTLVQPYTILILTEQNSLDITQLLFNKFANKYNYVTLTPEETGVPNTSLKQQYGELIVTQNFTGVGSGYRSVCVVNASLFIVKNILDVDKEPGLLIDTEKIDYISFGFAYTCMSDTQQFPSDEIGRSIKTTAGLGFSLTVPCVFKPKEKPEEKDCLTMKIIKIVAEKVIGNYPFQFHYFMNGVEFNYIARLTTCHFQTMPNGIPSIALGFSV